MTFQMRIEIATFSIDTARNKECTEIRVINRTSTTDDGRALH